MVVTFRGISLTASTEAELAAVLVAFRTIEKLALRAA
jgi:hypothetical protein